MRLASYISSMSLATLLAVGLLAIVVNVVNPYTTNWLGFTLFYLALFLVVLGLGSTLGFLFRFGLLKKKMEREAVVISFRQALLLTFLVLIVFYLFSKNLFSWLNLLALIIGLGGLEFFLLSLKTKEE